MSNMLRLLIFILGTGFTISVIFLLINKKISEKNSLLWLLGSLAVFFFSMAPLTLDKIAMAVGVNYPPALLFLFSILIALLISLIHSIQISSLNAQIRELAQIIAINNALNEKEKTSVKEGPLRNGESV
jgi:hypothetical protein